MSARTRRSCAKCRKGHRLNDAFRYAAPHGTLRRAGVLITGALIDWFGAARRLAGANAWATRVDSLIPEYGANALKVHDCVLIPCYPQLRGDEVATIIASVNAFE